MGLHSDKWVEKWVKPTRAPSRAEPRAREWSRLRREWARLRRTLHFALRTYASSRGAEELLFLAKVWSGGSDLWFE
ncbi:hypothetical protein HanLR1_Chr17g0677031 [Helianthus annuus]|nr:hypothetical protein HanLR1_Chr17g0677031 [Helianthus annuus]